VTYVGDSFFNIEGIELNINDDDSHVDNGLKIDDINGLIGATVSSTFDVKHIDVEKFVIDAVDDHKKMFARSACYASTL
jgi:hypothetical protein